MATGGWMYGVKMPYISRFTRETRLVGPHSFSWHKDNTIILFTTHD